MLLKKGYFIIPLTIYIYKRKFIELAEQPIEFVFEIVGTEIAHLKY